MPNNECIAYYDPGDDLSAHVGADVTGRRFVKISSAKQIASAALSNTTDGGNIIVSPCAAGESAIGVAAYDAVAAQKVPVLRGHKVVPVEAGGAITAGADVMSDASGRAVTWTSAASEANRRLGKVLNQPTAAGQVAIVALNL